MMLFFKDAQDRVLALQSDQAIGGPEQDKLCWLFEGAQPASADDPRLQGWFVGPRREMITPWSTVAVEICRNMQIEGLVRIEEFKAVPDQNAAYDPMLQALYHGLDAHVFTVERQPDPIRYVTDLPTYNKQEGLALNPDEMAYLEQLAQRLGRPLTDSELFGFSQVNSEHCRHKIFNGQFVIDGEPRPWSLFALIKKTSKEHPNRIVSAYKDNCAFVRGPEDVAYFAPTQPHKPSPFALSSHPTVISLKAETHNFPTTVEPFNGAATGSGGEIRDRMAGGKASYPLAGTAVYMTSYPRSEDDLHPDVEPRAWLYQTPEEVLTKASNGASDFGNKFGQPLICGSLLCFEHNEAQRHYGYDKVIMLAGGVGYAKTEDAQKDTPAVGDCVVLLGGDNYRIGMGGGAVSSVATGEYGNAIELNAVQRANPEMQKRVYNVIRAMADSPHNPIVSIHDHGAGGHLNCLSELVEATGGEVDIAALPVGDPTLSAREIVGNESQERMGLVVSAHDLPMVEATAQRERAPMYVIGQVTGDMRFTFKNSKTGEKPIDLALADMFGAAPKTVMQDQTIDAPFAPFTVDDTPDSLYAYARQVVQLESVACKDWLTNKVDRSVTGLIARQQCVGPLQLPLSDYGMTALSYQRRADGTFSGMATSLGHAPVVGLISAAAGSRLSIAEALTNLVFVPIEDGLQGVSLSANWMWPCRNKGEDARLYEAVQAASDFACALGINIPTGKDSLSMTQKYPDGCTVLAPGTVIISTVAPVPDVRKGLTPVINPDVPSSLIYVDFSGGASPSLGGSALAQCLGKIGQSCPDVVDPQAFKNSFALVQDLVAQELVVAGHDVSAGGLLSCVLEMCFANTHGGVQLDDALLKSIFPTLSQALFSEVPAVVLQVPDDKAVAAMAVMMRHQAHVLTLGKITDKRYVQVGALQFDIDALRRLWFKTSYRQDIRQSGPDMAAARFEALGRYPLHYRFPGWFDQRAALGLPVFGQDDTVPTRKPVAAIIREKGSQCEREMAWSLYLAGFEVRDVHTTDLAEGRETLEAVQLIAFVGGFSNADTLGSAKGWAGALLYNPRAKAALDAFYARPDTLSLGVCNGCQLMAHLGLITPLQPQRSPKMLHNDSHKFECNFVNIDIEQSPSIMMRALQGSRLGIWIAHGEGKFSFPDDISTYPIAARYSYDAYPANPNGSPQGVAAVCSPCGRHLAMMPHPERCIYPWNWAYYPADRADDALSPWVSMFIEARRWLTK